MSKPWNKLASAIGLAMLAACSGPVREPPPVAPVSAPLQRPRDVPPPVAAPAPVEPAAPAAPALPIDDSVRRDFAQAVDLMRAQQWEAAIDSLSALHQRRPRLSGPLVNLGIAYANTGKVAQAETALRQALALRESAVGWNQLGLLLRRAGRIDEARSAYEKALATDASFVFARLNLGVLCELYAADYACALSQYRAYLESQPEEAEQVRLWIFDLEQRGGRN